MDIFFYFFLSIFFQVNSIFSRFLIFFLVFKFLKNKNKIFKSLGDFSKMSKNTKNIKLKK